MILNPTSHAFPYKCFTKNDQGKALTAYLSDLGIGANSPNYPTWMAHRIYDDAADCGIAIKGMTATTWWYLVENGEFNDPDYSLGVTAWRFKPIPEHVRKFPAIAGMEVVIIND
jgi:hypothetical protein